MCSSKVAANSPAMSQAIGPCRWGNQPNNVAAPTGLEGKCIVVTAANSASFLTGVAGACLVIVKMHSIVNLLQCSRFPLLYFLTIQGFDSNVYILKFELFSVCRFTYEKYNITALISVSVSILSLPHKLPQVVAFIWRLQIGCMM